MICPDSTSTFGNLPFARLPSHRDWQGFQPVSTLWLPWVRAGTPFPPWRPPSPAGGLSGQGRQLMWRRPAGALLLGSRLELGYCVYGLAHWAYFALLPLVRLAGQCGWQHHDLLLMAQYQGTYFVKRILCHKKNQSCTL